MSAHHRIPTYLFFLMAFCTVVAHAAATEKEQAAPGPGASQPQVLPFVEGSWTLAILPDTQNYAERYPGLLLAQTAWIARHREQFNIRYVLHEGDITNGNQEFEWQRVREAFDELEGKVPYALAMGNHDYMGSGRAESRQTLLNRYFPDDEFKKWPTYGGLMKDGEMQNCYHLFRAGGTDWIVLALEYAPRDETIAWAGGVLEKHRDRQAIVVTHAYLYDDGTRYDYAAKKKSQEYSPHSTPTPGSMNDGEELWNKLIKRHNVAFVFSGHVLGTGAAALSSKNDAGKTVHQVLANYQMRPLGGEAYLRLVEFLPDGKTVQIKTYSPLYDRYLTEENQQFVLKRE
jgi:hypothetical protein